MKQITRVKGAALIMALLLVAIVAGISIAILFGQTVDIQRTIVKQAADQAYLDALYVPQWAKFQLNELNQQYQQEKKLPIWPQIMPMQTMVDGSVVNAQLIPATARFNVNNLAQPVSQYLTIFSNLLQVVDPNLNTARAQQITQNVQQWLLSSSQAGQRGNPYARMSPPYQAAHREMSSSSELRLVLGINADLYRRLSPYVIALPETNLPININAAPQPVLAALLGKNETAAASVVQYRKDNKGFLTVAQFFGLPGVKPFLQTGGKKNPFSSLVTVSLSNYYLLKIHIKRNKLNFHVFTILKFSTKTKTISIIQTGQSL